MTKLNLIKTIIENERRNESSRVTVWLSDNDDPEKAYEKVLATVVVGHRSNPSLAGIQSAALARVQQLAADESAARKPMPRPE